MKKYCKNKITQQIFSKKYEHETCKELSKQDEFVNQHKKHRMQITTLRFFIFISLLFIWEFCADFNLIDSFFFSSPYKICLCFIDLLFNNHLLLHMAYTLFETIVSFLLVFGISLLISTFLWYSHKLSEIMEPYLVILNSLPKSALAPLFIVWLGTGTTTIIVAGISVAIFGSIINFYTGFKQVDPEKVTLIYTLGGTKHDAFQKVILPGSIPILVSTTKVNIGLALVGVIIGEFLAARRGLGYLIIYSSQVFKMDWLLMSIVLLCCMAMGLYTLLRFIENWIQKKY